MDSTWLCRNSYEGRWEAINTWIQHMKGTLSVHLCIIKLVIAHFFITVYENLFSYLILVTFLSITDCYILNVLLFHCSPIKKEKA